MAGFDPFGVLVQHLLKFIDGQGIFFFFQVHHTQGFVGLHHFRPLHQDQGQLIPGHVQLPGKEIDDPHFVAEIMPGGVLFEDFQKIDQGGFIIPALQETVHSHMVALLDHYRRAQVALEHTDGDKIGSVLDFAA